MTTKQTINVFTHNWSFNPKNSIRMELYRYGNEYYILKQCFNGETETAYGLIETQYNTFKCVADEYAGRIKEILNNDYLFSLEY